MTDTPKHRMSATRPLIELASVLHDTLDAQFEREEWMRLTTAHALPAKNDLIGLNAGALYLSDLVFTPGRAYPFTGDTASRPGPAPHNVRQMLLNLAQRGGRPAFDLALAAYYSESAAVTRTMLEAWGRAVYVRLRPDQYGRWHDAPDDLSPEEARRWGFGLEPPSFAGEIAGVIARDGTADDQASFDDFDLRCRLLSQLVHPSGESIMQVPSRSDDLFLVGASFHELYAAHALNHLLVIQLAVLDEARKLGPQESGWDIALAKLRWAAEPVLAGMGNALGDARAQRDTERAAKRAAHTTTDLRQARATIAAHEAAMNWAPFPVAKDPSDGTA